MKNNSLFIGLVGCCLLAPIQSACAPAESPLGAERAEAAPLAERTPAGPRAAFSAAQVEALVRPDLDSCKGQMTTGRIETARINPARVIPQVNRRAIPENRIAKTLHGIWRGQVQGDYGDVKVDYFWIIDTNLREALIIAQRSGRETLAGAEPLEKAPKLTYLMCSHDGYSPGTNAPQIHEFTKIAATTDGAARIVEAATGMKSSEARPTPSQLWNGLLEIKYFDSLPYVAFAGALFKPIRIESIQNPGGGPPHTLVGWDAEYRGGGTTKLKYVTGVPTVGSERAVFVGTTARSGDYLIASPGNGSLWKVEAYPATGRRIESLESDTGWVIDGMDYSSYYDLAFDSVSLGPLE